MSLLLLLRSETVAHLLEGGVVGVSGVSGALRNLGPFVLHGTGSASGTSASPAFTLPSALPVDAYLLADVSWTDSGLGITAPTGWTVFSATLVTGVVNGNWYIRSDGSTLTHTWTLSGSDEWLVRWVAVGGCDPVSPVVANLVEITTSPLPTFDIAVEPSWPVVWPQEALVMHGYVQGAAATFTPDAALDELLDTSVTGPLSGCYHIETAQRHGGIATTARTTTSTSSAQAILSYAYFNSRRRWLLDRANRGPAVYLSRTIAVYPAWASSGAVIRLLLEVYTLTGTATVAAVLEQEHAAQVDTGIYTDTGGIAPLTEVGGGEVRVPVVGFKARCRLIVTGDPGDLVECQVTLEAVREDWA